ncbi:MAG TPA: hypothetical protein VHS31_01770 [Tepidisphaeraceae bacterium]|jgi:hypothetical protein|nr:hypothetical protein [Tepidisphaeraceae bacterium]
MGQATVDLPDPSEASTTPAPVASADDLLSQLAGDEIDRLLAEAEVEKGSAAPADATPPEPVADAPAADVTPTPARNETPEITSAGDDPLDVLHKELAGMEPVVPTAPITPHVPQPTPEIAPPDDSQLDDLFKELADAPAAKTEAPAPAPAAPATTIADPSAAAKELDEAIAKGSADALPEVKSAESETSQAEKDALTQVVEAIDSKTDNLPDLETPGAVPFYLKPLVWLNAPMMLLPDALRDAVGKIAILTLVNAVAVYAYVMLFRKHH